VSPAPCPNRRRRRRRERRRKETANAIGLGHCPNERASCSRELDLETGRTAGALLFDGRLYNDEKVSRLVGALAG
jgi:hypothetical protein